MAEKIVDAEAFERVQSELMEAAGLIHQLLELVPVDEATSHTEAVGHMARRAGWLVDRCLARLGTPGVRGPEWLEWCGGSVNDEVQLQPDMGRDHG
jgi:hypothetical protein